MPAWSKLRSKRSRNGESKYRNLAVMGRGNLIVGRELRVEGDFPKGSMQFVSPSINNSKYHLIYCLVFCSSTERQDTPPSLYLQFLAQVQV